MRLLIADKFPESYVAQFRSLGLAVEYEPDLTGDALAAKVADVEILVVRSTKVPRATIEHSTNSQML